MNANVRASVGVALLALVVACGDDPETPPGLTSGNPTTSPATGSAGSSSTQADSDPSTSTSASGSTSDSPSSSTASTSDGDTDPTTSTTEGDTNQSAECRACWGGACADEFEVCAASEDCACQIACEQDVECIQACPADPLFDMVLRCIVDASVGPCTETCDSACEACFVRGCEPEFDECASDTVCICRLWCDGDETCKDGCGPLTPQADALDACFTSLADDCANDCAG